MIVFPPNQRVIETRNTNLPNIWENTGAWREENSYIAPEIWADSPARSSDVGAGTSETEVHIVAIHINENDSRYLGDFEIGNTVSVGALCRRARNPDHPLWPRGRVVAAKTKGRVIYFQPWALSIG